MSQSRNRGREAVLNAEYNEALAASGLIDDIVDVEALDPRPFRYAEGQFLCGQGDSPQCLWVIVSGSVAVREHERTLFVRQRNQVVGEQNLVSEHVQRAFDLVANQSNVEVLVIEKSAIDRHRERETIWRNIARIISKKLKYASSTIASLSRQLEDDTRILHAYTNQYALSRRLKSGGDRLSNYQVDKAIVWFSDVVDFSRYSLTLAPERTAEIVQRFFNAQSLPIAAHGGHIDKFIGDGLMAFWVLPEGMKAAGSGGACLAALRAAEEARDMVARIRIGRKPLRLRIGLHVGLVLSGDFGSNTRHQFTLIGPEVNKAARLEQVHAEEIVAGDRVPGDIRLSEEFFRQVGRSVQRQYPKSSTAKAKNIGEISFHS